MNTLIVQVRPFVPSTDPASSCTRDLTSVVETAAASSVKRKAVDQATTTPSSPETKAQKILSNDALRHVFGHTFFRLVRDATADRGCVQRSLILLTHQPFTALYKRLIRLVARAYFGASDCNGNRSALESAWQHMCTWPAPQLGSTFDLPFVGGVVLTYHVPFAHNISHIIDAPPPTFTPLQPFGHTNQLVSNLDGIDVYATFANVIPSLWLLWELVVTGEPILVWGSTPTHASDGVLALLSLITPLAYGGDVHPFFTVQNAAFAAYVRQRDGPRVTAIVGVANPLFLRAMPAWRHVISIGEIDDDGASAAVSARNARRQLRSPTALPQSRMPSSNRARRAQSRSSANLNTCTIASPRTPIVRAPAALLALLRVPSDGAQTSVARAAWHSIADTASDAASAAAQLTLDDARHYASNGVRSVASATSSLAWGAYAIASSAVRSVAGGRTADATAVTTTTTATTTTTSTATTTIPTTSSTATRSVFGAYWPSSTSTVGARTVLMATPLSSSSSSSSSNSSSGSVMTMTFTSVTETATVVTSSPASTLSSADVDHADGHTHARDHDTGEHVTSDGAHVADKDAQNDDDDGAAAHAHAHEHARTNDHTDGSTVSTTSSTTTRSRSPPRLESPSANTHSPMPVCAHTLCVCY
jgi:hypothetical protein